VGTAETPLETAPEILISPPSRWAAIDLRELWAYRELIYFLTKRELQIRYKQSFFGVSWAVLQPLTLAFVFAVIFGAILNVPSDDIPYAVFVVSGVVPWLFTSQAVMASAQGMVKDADLISKVYFPRLALPVSQAFSLMLDMVISFLVVILVTLLYGVHIASTFWLIPAFVLLGVVTTFALGALFAAINVKYRDVQLVMPMVLQVIFFATPVLYPASLVTGAWSYIWAINPLVSVLNGVRWALYAAPYPGTAPILISVGSTLALVALALIYFQRTQRFFADIV
jgi:homopolymeric O-antigen transport system permease protein